MIMMSPSFPFLVVFSIVAFGMVIVFCTLCCKICSVDQVQVERHAQICREQENLRSIYIIPFPQRISRHDSEDMHATAIHSEHPPSYDELGLKSDDLPPPYTYSNFAENCSAPPLPPTNVAPSYSDS